jgi:Plasmid stabilisation system protein.
VTFVVIVNDQAEADLRAIDDNRTLSAISRKIDGLEQDPHMQGKPLGNDLKNYRAVRAAGQRYRIIYQVAMLENVVTVVVVGIRKEGDKRDAYRVAGKRLGK